MAATRENNCGNKRFDFRIVRSFCCYAAELDSLKKIPGREMG